MGAAAVESFGLKAAARVKDSVFRYEMVIYSNRNVSGEAAALFPAPASTHDSRHPIQEFSNFLHRGVK
jgi:hypothetical protein